MNNLDSKIQKLPKWAKDHIETIQTELDYTKLQLEEYKGNKPTNTFIYQYVNQHIPLPKNSQIEFILENNLKIRVGIDYHEPTKIRIDGDREVSISPTAANSFKVKVIPYNK